MAVGLRKASSQEWEKLYTDVVQKFTQQEMSANLIHEIKKVEDNFSVYLKKKNTTGLVQLGFAFSDLLSSTEMVFQADLLERIQTIVRNFSHLKKSHEAERTHNPFSWLTFPVVFRDDKLKNPSCGPIRVTDLHVSVQHNKAEKKCYWQGMYSCYSPKTSPELIDEFGTYISSDLLIKDHELAMMVDLGSGGCLPTIAVVSQLLRLKNLLLVLIDTDYTEEICSTYELKKESISTERNVEMALLNETERAAWNFLHQYANLLKEDHKVMVSIYPSTEVFLKDRYLLPLERVKKQFLVTIDPHKSPEFAQCFDQIAYCMIEGSVIPYSFYRLNATIQLSKSKPSPADRFRLSSNQALNSYQFLS